MSPDQREYPPVRYSIRGSGDGVGRTPNGPICRYGGAVGPVLVPMGDHRCVRVPLSMTGRPGRAKRPGLDGAGHARMPGMSGRALSFGGRAEACGRFRPGYPAELFDLVMAYAGQPVRTALEVGAGTGKATRLFAQRGSRSPRPSLTGPCSPGCLSTCQQTSRPCEPRSGTCDRARATGSFTRRRRCTGRARRAGGLAWPRCWSPVACLPRSAGQPGWLTRLWRKLSARPGRRSLTATRFRLRMGCHRDMTCSARARNSSGPKRSPMSGRS